MFENSEEAFIYLRSVGNKADEDVDLTETALALALVFLPGLHVDRYRQHLRNLCAAVAQEHATCIANGKDDSALLQANILGFILHETYKYHGDTEKYDDLQNANLIRVIERRKGLPVALGILYIIAAQAQGWNVNGLNFPGHFLIRLEKDGQRVIIDPFQNGAEMNAASLRELLKSCAGDNAELNHNYYDIVDVRTILLRLQNNLKTRLIENEDYAHAISVIETMEAIAPQEYRALFDKAVLYIKLEQPEKAAIALNNYINSGADEREKQYAHILLQEINATLT